jgi:hypothetical protein
VSFLNFSGKTSFALSDSFFKSNGYGRISENVEEGGSFLVAIKGELFEICQDFCVLQNYDGIYSIGAGYEYALGAMFEQGDPYERCEKGLFAALHFSPFVLEPFVSVVSRREK